MAPAAGPTHARALHGTETARITAAGCPHGSNARFDIIGKRATHLIMADLAHHAANLLPEFGPLFGLAQVMLR
jgi:hypothetical protein